MSFLKKIWRRISSGFFYVVDLKTLIRYLEQDLAFAAEHDLEASANINVYINGEKHHLQIWNYSASQDEQEKGVIFYFDSSEYKSLDELVSVHLSNMNTYFKIELLDADDVFLNAYKEAHPHLNVEDYE